MLLTMAYSNTVGKKEPIQKQNVGKREAEKKKTLAADSSEGV